MCTFNSVDEFDCFDTSCFTLSVVEAILINVGKFQSVILSTIFCAFFQFYPQTDMSLKNSSTLLQKSHVKKSFLVHTNSRYGFRISLISIMKHKYSNYN